MRTLKLLTVASMVAAALVLAPVANAQTTPDGDGHRGPAYGRRTRGDSAGNRGRRGDIHDRAQREGLRQRHRGGIRAGRDRARR